MVCTDTSKGRTGEDRCGIGESGSFWDVLANSHFCIEPPGDTLIRSHFYLAVQSGCIPVIFDGGSTRGFYNESIPAALPTWWPWRSSAIDFIALDDSSIDEPKEPFIRYSEFAVVFSSEEVYSGSIDVVKTLQEMP